jgi:hypothetical protein
MGAFEESILEYWKLLVTGSLLAAGLFFWSLFGGPMPFWLAWTIFVATVILAVYLPGRNEHGKRMDLEDRLRPKLKLIGIGPHSADHYRVTVHNLTERAVKFRARLIDTYPKLQGFPLPVDLEPTHSPGGSVGEIGPHGNHGVDVYVDDGNPVNIFLKLLGNPPCMLPIPKKSRMELQIIVYPPLEDGDADRRWFYIVPQRDGTVVFSPNGPGLMPTSSGLAPSTVAPST